MATWKTPEGNFVKTNRDAAFVSKNKRMVARIIIRDFDGEIMVSLCMNKRKVSHFVIVEIKALWRALKLYSQLNFTNVIFEGDAQVVTKAINQKGNNWLWYGQ